jgi:hypothetical protein
MLARSDVPVDSVVAKFAGRGLEVGLLVPTETGLRKSIMDAHASLRDYFVATKYHDFSSQAQGQGAKVTGPARFVHEDRVSETTVSLYRPETKTGDPRIWFSGLPKYANSTNLLAILVDKTEDAKGVLYVINMSVPRIAQSEHDAASPFAKVLQRISARAFSRANELRQKLVEVGERGYVRSLRAGPTGIGYTLETLLGIEANSSRTPDYHGIELKSGRVAGAGNATTRTTLFSQVPDWKASTVKSAAALVTKYGYVREGRQQLYCSMSNVPNSLKLFLNVESTEEWLHSCYGTAEDYERVVQWSVPLLKDALKNKHKETFWVKARVRKAADGAEEFLFERVVHTRSPVVNNFAELVRGGHIEVDFLVHLIPRPGGKVHARDHGYLFKMWAKNLGLLFPPSLTYELVTKRPS